MHHLVKPNGTAGSCRVGTIQGLTYSQLVEILGEPNVDDDSSRVDASWGFQHRDYPHLEVGVWNYKNGPAYGACEHLNDIDLWSLYFSERPQKMTLFLDELFGDNWSL